MYIELSLGIFGLILFAIMAILDHFNMKLIHKRYGNHSDNFKAYVKGAVMGAIKVFIVMAIIIIYLINNVGAISHIYHLKKDIIDNYNQQQTTLINNNLDSL